MNTLSIIIVVYNSKQHLDTLYKSLSLQTYRNFTIYFIDNASADGSLAYSEQINNFYKLNISYIRLNYNSGFARGNNIGAEKALENNSKFILFLNPDMVLERECLKKLLDVLEFGQQVAVSGPIIFYGNKNYRQKKIQEYGAKINFSNYKIKKNFEDKEYCRFINDIPETLEVDFLSGGCILFKTEIFFKIGQWEESFFMYADEMDICKRLLESGYKLIVTKNAKVWHNHNWTKKNKDSHYFEWYYIKRNQYLYFHKYRLYKNLLFSFLKDILLLPITVKWALKVCDKKLIFFFYKGILDGIKKQNGKAKIKF